MRRSERLGIAVSVVCLGFLYAINFPLPSRELFLRVFGHDFHLAVSGATQMALLLTAAISLGVDATMRSHPRHMQRSLLYTATYWPMSAIITVGMVILLPGITWWASQVALILLAGGMLTLVIYLQYQAVNDEGQVRRGPRLLLNGLAYVLALLCFGYVYGAHLRSAVSVSTVALLSGALALGLLRDAQVHLGRIWLYATATAVSMGELTMALNYLSMDVRVVGPFMLVCFYTLVGLGQQHLWQRLNRRTVLEYVLVAVAGLVGLGLLAN